MPQPRGAVCNAMHLVEGHGGAEEGVDDVGVVVKLLVHHEREDAHLRGTAVVELDGALGLLLLGREGVPAKVERAVAEVARELRIAGHILHHSKLKEAHKGEDLRKTGGRHDLKGLEAVGHVREGEAVRDVAGEAHASGGHDVAEDGEHADAAVLHLHVPEAVKALLVSLVEEAEGVEEAERGLRADLRLEGHHRRRAGCRARAEGGAVEGEGGHEEVGEHDCGGERGRI
mmetsp:Transcript_14698/g.35692  ORF Transcript_14698/g.35692 Transcript_14698/m.35692 type:complete len:230 (-) Transcript_14698:13-702(-)